MTVLTESEYLKLAMEQTDGTIYTSNNEVIRRKDGEWLVCRRPSTLDPDPVITVRDSIVASVLHWNDEHNQPWSFS